MISKDIVNFIVNKYDRMYTIFEWIVKLNIKVYIAYLGKIKNNYLFLMYMNFFLNKYIIFYYKLYNFS